MKHTGPERWFMDKIEKTVLEWIKKAENDYLACRILMQAKEFPVDVFCFHCGQTVEKNLKAVLVYHQKKIKKIHDLGSLLEECMEFVPELEDIVDDVEVLESFGPEVRYPGWPDIHPEDIPELLEKMEKVRERIRGYFKDRGIL